MVALRDEVKPQQQQKQRSKRVGVRLPPETREQQQKRATLKRRLRELGLPVQRAADVVGISDQMLYKLLDGEVRVSRVLGWDRWTETVAQKLDDYEVALLFIEEHAQMMKAELEARKLPVTWKLRALLPEQRGRRAVR